MCLEKEVDKRGNLLSIVQAEDKQQRAYLISCEQERDLGQWLSSLEEHGALLQLLRVRRALEIGKGGAHSVGIIRRKKHASTLHKPAPPLSPNHSSHI